MCNQKRPFEAYSLNGLAVKVLEANFAPVSEFYSKELRDLIKKMLQKKEKDRPTILEFLQTNIIKKRVASYLKEVYDHLSQENGDKVLLEGVLYQAKKLGIALGPQTQGQDSSRKVKPEFSAEKKRQEKERIKLQLEEELKKLS
jgi:serine/threonine protein kinase